jgi:hypothetical protein
METVRERLVKFIKYQGITVTAFEKKCNLATSYVANIRTSIQPDKAMSISQNYPELNFDWLILGRGSMLYDVTQQNDDEIKFRISLNKEVERLQRENERLLSIIEALSGVRREKEAV